MTKVGTMRCSIKLTAKPWSLSGTIDRIASFSGKGGIEAMLVQKLVKD
jgi:hypothetical protein